MQLHLNYHQMQLQLNRSHLNYIARLNPMSIKSTSVKLPDLRASK
jgi:hypothetical protein